MKTLVLGASTKPTRYSNIAIQRLRSHNYGVVAIGRTQGNIADVDILTGQPDLEDIHTITMYLSPKNQKDLYDYILSLKPHRIIFNPGTENPELSALAKAEGIHVEDACTLVLLSTGTYSDNAEVEV